MDPQRVVGEKTLQRLTRACQGRSASEGGMNKDELARELGRRYPAYRQKVALSSHSRAELESLCSQIIGGTGVDWVSSLDSWKLGLDVSDEQIPIPAIIVRPNKTRVRTTIIVQDWSTPMKDVIGIQGGRYAEFHQPMDLRGLKVAGESPSTGKKASTILHPLGPTTRKSAGDFLGKNIPALVRRLGPGAQFWVEIYPRGG